MLPEGVIIGFLFGLLVMRVWFGAKKALREYDKVTSTTNLNLDKNIFYTEIYGPIEETLDHLRLLTNRVEKVYNSYKKGEMK